MIIEKKGEGGANVVWQYAPDDKDGKWVIRTRKLKEKEGDVGASLPAAALALEQETWGGLLQAGGSLDSLEAGMRYRDCMIAPFISPQYLLPQELILLNDEDAARYGSREAILMPDATLLPPPALPTPTICVELKPKFGSIMICPTVRPEDSRLKHSISRYRLHQLLKAEQGDVATPNQYDPVDLFSGEEIRMDAALHALVDCPQNNLVLFLDGRRCDGADADAIEAAAQDLFCPASFEDAGSGCAPRSALVRLLRGILQQESVLAEIAKAQRVCQHDVEGLYWLYRHLLEDNQNSDIFASASSSEDQKDARLAAHQRSLRSLLSLPKHEALQVFRDYSVSTTAKDCSIMIAMQRADDESVSSGQLQGANRRLEDCGCVPHPGSGFVRYRVAVVDLDLKPLAKIAKHHALDREILAAAQRNKP